MKTLLFALLVGFLAHFVSAACPAVAQTHTYCTNVDWPVDETVMSNAYTANTELTIQSEVAVIRGSRQCKAMYRDLFCRSVFPKCGIVQSRPCRANCEYLLARCPGIISSCENFPNAADVCYSLPNFKNSAMSSTVSIAVVVLSAIAVMYSM